VEEGKNPAETIFKIQNNEVWSQRNWAH